MRDINSMRKWFIDNLRWIVIFLLIPYHAAQAFNVWGEMNYICFTPNKAISSMTVFLSPYYMPLMFLLAGMSTRYALKKRTYGQFVVERIKRLLVPFIFGTLFFCPILSYLGDKNNYGYKGGFFAHYKVFFTRWTDLAGFDGGFNVGQFWFLYFLFVISVVGIGIIGLVNFVKADRDNNDGKDNEGSKEMNGKVLSFPVVCLFVIPLPFLYDILSIGGKSFAEYLYIFLIGYYFLSDDRMIDKAARYRYITLAVGLIACVVNVYMFIWSGKDFGTWNIIAKAFAEWFMILALVGIGKNSLDITNKAFRFFLSRSFLVFSIHFVWVVLFQGWFSGLLGSSTVLMFFVPIICSYIVTFICSEIAYRIPVLCFLMGTKSK